MYLFSRILQFIAMIDCCVALIWGMYNPAAYGKQLIFLFTAVLLFYSGRVIQNRFLPDSPKISVKQKE
ncbi:MAG: hypothetical protein CMH79_03165 [Nitrospinae bacterium]|mgnify:CR=1 FL=1|nr:hypothetical protein [Nitrospinota bacterium]